MSLIRVQFKRSPHMKTEQAIIDFEKMAVKLERKNTQFKIRKDEGHWWYLTFEKGYKKLSEEASEVIEKAHKQWTFDKIVLEV